MSSERSTEWEPISYARPGRPSAQRLVTIDKTYQRDGTFKWKVSRGRSCFNKQGEWEYEPLPSHRDDAFLQRCRYDTLSEAMVAASLGEQR